MAHSVNRTSAEPHLRLTLRRPYDASLGRKHIVLNDGLEVVGADGEALADLSSYLRKSEIIRGIGDVHIWKLELYAGEVVVEIDRTGRGAT